MKPLVKSIFNFQLNWKAASLFVQLDPDWNQKIRTGGLWVFVPLIGWPISLGYRKVLIDHLRSGQEVLPGWQHVSRFLKEGLRSAAVIFAFYSPLYLLLGILLIQRGPIFIPWWSIALFFSLLTMFLPLLLPAIILSNFLFGHPPFQLEFKETFLIMVAFWTITFFIPSAFLQVSRTGRYRSAFNLFRVFSFIFRNGKCYIEAWLYSAMVSIIGHIRALRHPWSIFWSYQSILYSFNEILNNEEMKNQQNLANLFSRMNSHKIKLFGRSVKFFGVEIPSMEI